MILLKARMTEHRPIDVVRDAWRDITRESYRAVGQFWVDNYLQGHFKAGAGQKYGYQFRSRAYRARKDRKFAEGKPMSKGGAPVIAGSDTPLVLTGYMKREMTRNYIIRGFPTRCTVYMYGPAYLTTRFFKKAQPDKPKEITTVRTEERRELSRVLQQELVNRINAYRATRVTE